MITLKQTISFVTKEANATEDMDTALNLLDLQAQLNAQLKAEDSTEWHYPSIVIGFLMGCAFIILLYSGNLHADELNVNLTSWHSNTDYEYNNKNYGLGYTKDFNHHWQGKVGFYENSYKKQSTYLMANLKHDMKNWRWGVQFGFVTGYDDIELDGKESYTESYDDDHEDKKTKDELGKVKNLSKFQFIVLPTATWKVTKEHSLTLGYMPSFSKDTFSFATLTYNFKF